MPASARARGRARPRPTRPAEFRLNLADGRTLRARLDTPEGRDEWGRRLADPEFHATITGAAVLFDGVTHALPAPRGFRSLRWGLEQVEDGDRVLGWRVTCYADGIRSSVLVYANGSNRLARTDVRRVGRLRYDPGAEVGR